MLHGQALRTSNKHVTHYAPRPGFPYPQQTRYPLWSTVRLSVPLTNTLLTMLHGQAFRTPIKYVTHYGPRSGFRPPNKHVTHYGPRSGFPYP